MMWRHLLESEVRMRTTDGFSQWNKILCVAKEGAHAVNAMVMAYSSLYVIELPRCRETPQTAICCLPNRSKQDMVVCGLSLHLGSSESRKTLEQKFIFQIGTLNPHGINERFSFN